MSLSLSSMRRRFFGGGARAFEGPLPFFLSWRQHFRLTDLRDYELLLGILRTLAILLRDIKLGYQ